MMVNEQPTPPVVPPRSWLPVVSIRITPTEDTDPRWEVRGWLNASADAGGGLIASDHWYVEHYPLGGGYTIDHSIGSKARAERLGRRIERKLARRGRAWMKRRAKESLEPVEYVKSVLL